MHTDHISLKVSKAIGIIYRLKDVYPLLVLQTLYNTLILPYFNYCILSWGATISNGNRLHLLQTKFAENLLRYCLIMQLNMEKCSVLITSKVHTHSFLGYKTYLKQKAINLYSDHCTILQCYVCQKLSL